MASGTLALATGSFTFQVADQVTRGLGFKPTKISVGLSGVAANLIRSSRNVSLTLTSGVYATNFADSVRDFALPTTGTSLSLAGQTANLAGGSTSILAQAGSYGLNGYASGFARNFLGIFLAAGSFSLTGRVAQGGLRKLLLDLGSYGLSGRAADFYKTGVPSRVAKLTYDSRKDHYVARSGADYAVAFANLLPRGLAWPRDPNSLPMKVVRGLSKVWGYIESRVAELLTIESDPRVTINMLPDWERNWGLPDPCYDEPFTIGDRQKALVQRVTIEGAQSRQFFIDTAAQIGYTIWIEEYRPFMVGIDACGDNRTLTDGVYGAYPYVFGPPENRYYWKVHVGVVRLTWFRCGGGGGQVGYDPHLRIALATDLECVLNRWKPAHTKIIWDYSGLSPFGNPMEGTP